jgi:hypothetical protein
MSEYHYKDLADVLLARFAEYARDLCEFNLREHGLYEFSSQDMIKKAAQQNQDAYVQWLERCRVQFPNYIFNKAHEDFGNAIFYRAGREGYDKFEEGITEKDIFGNPTRRVTYRPKQ